MTPDEAVDFINKRLTLGWPFKDWGLVLNAEREREYPPREHDVKVHVRLNAPHRDTGQRGAGVQMLFHLHIFWGESDLTRYLRARLIDLVIHELDESILVDGKRVFDPHAKEAK